MNTQDLNVKTRFDARLTVEQKTKFEKASKLAGFKNLSEFVITTVNKEAEDIIEKNERIIVSKRDSEIFFNALMNPKEPNQNLKDAYEEFKFLLK